ncbi:hypothetical protein JHK86_005378 [Glycine max]|nr:hypothetical protein JHK86_005378 [Glycine max]
MNGRKIIISLRSPRSQKCIFSLLQVEDATVGKLKMMIKYNSKQNGSKQVSYLKKNV